MCSPAALRGSGMEQSAWFSFVIVGIKEPLRVTADDRSTVYISSSTAKLKQS